MIFANKQDLPGAKEPKELEKLLGLYELSFAMSTLPPQMIKSSSTVPLSSNINNTVTSLGRCTTPIPATSNLSNQDNHDIQNELNTDCTTSSNASPNKCNTLSHSNTTALPTYQQYSFKGWYIQPACAITGDGLQEGLEALYDMIIKKRKLNKAHKKKR